MLNAKQFRQRSGSLADKITGDLFADGITIAAPESAVIGLSIGAVATGISMAAAVTTGITISGTKTTGVSISGTSTTGIVITGATTGITLAGTMTTGITVGVTGTRISLSAAGNRLIAAYGTSALTAGTTTSMIVSQTQTVASTSGSIETARFEVVSEVKTGNWTNAIVGQINYGAAGYVHGLAGVICAELDMPTGGVPGAQGTYTIFEGELNCPTGYTGGVPISLINWNVWGNATAIGDFEDSGYLLDLQGFTANTGNIHHDAAPGTLSASLRCRIGTTIYYLPLYDTQTA